MLTLPMATFAAPPRGHHNPPPSHHHGGHHGGHHGHHYHSSSHYYSNDAFWAFLGFSALTAIAVAASTSSKKKKEKVVVVQEKYEEPEDLTITAEQQAKLQKLFDENKDYIAKLRTEKDLKTVALEQEKAKAKPNEATIATLENELSQLSMNIFRVTQDTKRGIQTILTPAQYEAMQDMQL